MERFGIKRLVGERTRQINVEGWTPQHDDSHSDAEMADAAAVYAFAASELVQGGKQDEIRRYILSGQYQSVLEWPWDIGWLKVPNNAFRAMEKAGALALAEAERIMRKAGSTNTAVVLDDLVYVLADLDENGFAAESNDEDGKGELATAAAIYGMLSVGIQRGTAGEDLVFMFLGQCTESPLEWPWEEVDDSEMNGEEKILGSWHFEVNMDGYCAMIHCAAFCVLEIERLARIKDK